MLRHLAILGTILLPLVAGDTKLLPILRDLDGHPVSPLASSPGTRGVILFFVAPDCPISNRYAPTMARIARDAHAHGITTWLIYADDQADIAVIKKHQSDFSLPLPTAVDHEYLLTNYTGAAVTPEAIVYLPSLAPEEPPRLIYRGRIDDQYEGFGRYRPFPTRSELVATLDQIIAGSPPDIPIFTKAIGCYIPPPLARPLVLDSLSAHCLPM